ncbi:unannotated protein [freshwater metagenome]|uniref:Unannotated protein n=1 Tax=freshwater metagenome TaxID=449393 RepID=A0A6J7VGE9_9ZZZZ
MNIALPEQEVALTAHLNLTLAIGVFWVIEHTITHL